MTDSTSGAAVTSAVEVDLSQAVARLSAGSSSERPIRDLLLPVIVRALTTALERHPIVNARLDTEAGVIVFPEAVDLRLTISGEQAEATALLPRVAELTDEDLEARIEGVRTLAALGHGVVDTTAATFVLIERRGSSLLFETPPLAADVSCTLAVGTLERRPLADARYDVGLRIGWATYLCLTYDHRLIDGADAARFLSELASLLSGDH